MDVKFTTSTLQLCKFNLIEITCHYTVLCFARSWCTAKHALILYVEYFATELIVLSAIN